MSSSRKSLVCFTASHVYVGDVILHHDIYIVEFPGNRRKNTPKLMPNLRVSGHGDVLCLLKSGVYLFNSRAQVFLHSVNPRFVGRIDVSKYWTASSVEGPRTVDETMVETMAAMNSAKKIIQVLPTPDGKIIAFSLEIHRPNSPNAPMDVVDFELYHPETDKWESLPSIHRGLEISPGSFHQSPYVLRIVAYWFMDGKSVFAVMSDEGFIFHLDVTAVHRSWTYQPGPGNKNMLRAASVPLATYVRYIYMSKEWCMTPYGAKHITGQMPGVSRWFVPQGPEEITRICVQGASTGGLPSLFHIVESSISKKGGVGGKLTIYEYTCSIRSYLKRLRHMEAKQKALEAKINKKYEEKERKVREVHNDGMELRNWLNKLRNEKSNEVNAAKFKQVPQLDIRVPRSLEFHLVIPKCLSWALGDACFL